MKTQWISVKDKLPPVCTKVLAWHRHRKTWLCATRYCDGYKSKKFRWVHYDVDGHNFSPPEDISHWMYIPKLTP